MTVRLRPIYAISALALMLAGTGRSQAQLKPPPAPPPVPCVADPSGIIDFQGQLGNAGGNSNVKILPSTEVSEYYVASISRQLGPPAAQEKQVTTIADLEALERRALGIPGMLAAAHTAPIVSGTFKCIGFSPGRYIFLSQVFGGGGHVGDAPAAIAYYRADVDVSSVKRHSIVLVRGFRRIGSYPPGS